eukprot:CAMPEP_0113484982 /NCGR_PEP_ID=MMETSP0014_2-20120614/24247_1 /TAXON_ID=2857 /ORGANISM="Nitzschia sp." /LENGTH=191 /DNA_ID=CAMNT_0000378611 /DNA_START=32 /DNA_END=607 /DNA_ORIENTATION=- /assembly_acc=CAM_ASM_000159
MKHPFFLPLTFFSFASQQQSNINNNKNINMPLSLSLETKTGEKVDETTLNGKIVALYFSSSWCPACKTFTPLLSVLHEEAQEDDIPFEVVYVSSDRSPEDCVSYMTKSHGDWLKVSWDTRNDLKQTYGAFAGSEQSLFPETKRRSGIPTLVVIDQDGNEKLLMDCDDSKVIKDIESKGTKFLDQWQQFKWN